MVKHLFEIWLGINGTDEAKIIQFGKDITQRMTGKKGIIFFRFDPEKIDMTIEGSDQMIAEEKQEIESFLKESGFGENLSISDREWSQIQVVN